jgi:hypothetical protein
MPWLMTMTGSASFKLAPLTRNETVVGRAGRMSPIGFPLEPTTQSVVPVSLPHQSYISKVDQNTVSSCCSSDDSTKSSSTPFDASCDPGTSFHPDIKVLHQSKWAADRKSLIDMPRHRNTYRNHNGTQDSGVSSTWEVTVSVCP